MDEFSSCQLPNNNLCVFSRARDKLVTLADNYLSDVVEVAVQRSLKCESFSVPDFYDSKEISPVRFLTHHQRH